MRRREARTLVFEWAHFARSIRRHARTRPDGEREMWRKAECEDVDLALKYRDLGRK